MELICEKYKEKVAAEKAVCRRPKEYCKFRSACMIQFVSKQNAAKEDEPESGQKKTGKSADNGACP